MSHLQKLPHIPLQEAPSNHCLTGCLYQVIQTTGLQGSNVLKLLPILKSKDNQIPAAPFSLTPSTATTVNVPPPVISSPPPAPPVSIISGPSPVSVPLVRTPALGNYIIAAQNNLSNTLHVDHPYPFCREPTLFLENGQLRLPTNSVPGNPTFFMMNKKAVSPVKPPPMLPTGHSLQIPAHAKVISVPVSSLPFSIQQKILPKVSGADVSKVPPVIYVSPVNTIKSNNNQSFPLHPSPNTSSITSEVKSPPQQMPPSSGNEAPTEPMKWIVQESQESAACLVPVKSSNDTASKILQMLTNTKMEDVNLTNSNRSQAVQIKDNALVMCNNKIFFLTKRGTELIGVGSKNPEPPQYKKPEPPQYKKPEPPQYKKPEPPQYKKPEPPQYKKPELPQYKKPEPLQYKKPEPPQYKKPEPPQYKKPEPPQYKKPEPPQYKKPEPPQYKKPEPPQYSSPERPAPQVEPMKDLSNKVVQVVLAKNKSPPPGTEESVQSNVVSTAKPKRKSSTPRPVRGDPEVIYIPDDDNCAPASAKPPDVPCSLSNPGCTSTINAANKGYSVKKNYQLQLKSEGTEIPTTAKTPQVNVMDDKSWRLKYGLVKREKVILRRIPLIQAETGSAVSEDMADLIEMQHRQAKRKSSTRHVYPPKKQKSAEAGDLNGNSVYPVVSTDSPSTSSVSRSYSVPRAPQTAERSSSTWPPTYYGGEASYPPSFQVHRDIAGHFSEVSLPSQRFHFDSMYVDETTKDEKIQRLKEVLKEREKALEALRQQNT